MCGKVGSVWFVCAGIAIGLASSAAQAAPLQNGSFELPLLADGAVQQITPLGWSWAGQPGFLFNVVGTSQTAADANQFVDIGNTPAFSLLQEFSVSADGRYRLAWYDNAAAFAQVAPYRIEVGSGLVDLDFDANEGIDGTWNVRTVELDLLAGTTYSLVFSPRNIPAPLPAQDRYIDGITLAPVPEPASAWLVLCGLVGILGVAARRRSPAGA